MFLGQMFANNAKITLEHCFELPKTDKIWNRKSAEIRVNDVNVAFFGILNGKTQLFFQDVKLKFCTHIHRQAFFHI